VPVTAQLNDIVEALEMPLDEYYCGFDLDAGEVVAVSESLLSAAEEPDAEEPDLPDWQKEEWEITKRLVASEDRFVPLPSKFDVHEWGIMEEFSRSVESDSIRADLSRAIHGGGAFRHFKETVRRLGIEEAWFAFREEALREIARDWCEEHQIAWE
jgi:uncharacterized protein UPF0158